jgi:N-glycosidase YbiA
MPTSTTANTIDRFEGPHSFLSNFYRSTVRFDGVNYPTAEHAYQAAKCELADDRKAVRRCSSPMAAKRFGSSVLCRPGWDFIRVDVMAQVLEAKFKGDLADMLLATGVAGLVEGNGWGDIFWGMCNGEGENRLGVLLMELRASLQNGSQ